MADMFNSNEIVKILADEFNEYEEKNRVISLIFSGFNHIWNSYLPLITDINIDENKATEYSFIRHREILMRKESLLFFKDLLTKQFFDEPDINEYSEGEYPPFILSEAINDNNILSSVIAICGIAYSWKIEYRLMQRKGIDSNAKTQQRIRALEKDYKTYSDKQHFLKNYKFVSPIEFKEMKTQLFTEGLETLLAQNKHRTDILKILTLKILSSTP